MLPDPVVGKKYLTDHYYTKYGASLNIKDFNVDDMDMPSHDSGYESPHVDFKQNCVIMMPDTTNTEQHL